MGETTDVVIVSGGIAGIATAYFLGQAGVQSVVVERDAIGQPRVRFRVWHAQHPRRSRDSWADLCRRHKGMRLHRKLSQSLPEETGVSIEYRRLSALSLAFTDDEAETAKSHLVWQQ